MTKLVQNPYWILIAVLVVMSFILFLRMADDKARAKSGQRRIPEATLSLLAFLGGALGGALGMRLFRHKTRHWYFALGFPLIALVQWGLSLWLLITHF
jgi:uncharacterized membrane protein YsdA (DUF1294 family)